MFEQNQTVYFKTGSILEEAIFIRYEGENCLLSTTLGEVKIRKARVFTVDEAQTRLARRVAG